MVSVVEITEIIYMLSKQFKVSRDFGPATTARFHHFDSKKSFVFLLGYFHTNAF